VSTEIELAEEVVAAIPHAIRMRFVSSATKPS